MAAVYRLRTAGEEAAEPGRSRGRRPRGLVLALVAGALVTVLGVSTALAQGGVLSAGLQGELARLGLGNTASRYIPVNASATDAGITLHATAAYADASAVGIAVHTDAAPDKELDFLDRPTLVGADGQALVQSWVAPDAKNEDAEVIFFSPIQNETVKGSEFTLTVHSISRLHPQPGNQAAVPMAGVKGSWVLRFRVTPTATRSTPIPTPAPGDIGDVHVSFAGFHRFGSYVAGEVDLSAPTPAAMSQALAAYQGTGLLNWMLGPDVPVPAGFPLANAFGEGPELTGSPIHEDGLPPSGKPGPPPNTASHYAEHFVWLASNPGTYHLIVGSSFRDGGPWVVRAIQVR